MFFNKTYEDRLRVWHDFRQALETSNDPIQDAIDAYDTIPTEHICVDPYTPSAWPNPWELISENHYCLFAKLLAIGYSLQLTERFKESEFEIHISTDRKNSLTCYLLIVDNVVVNWEDDSQISKSELPDTLVSQTVYTMPSLQ